MMKMNHLLTYQLSSFTIFYSQPSTVLVGHTYKSQLVGYYNDTTSSMSSSGVHNSKHIDYSSPLHVGFARHSVILVTENNTACCLVNILLRQCFWIEFPEHFWLEIWVSCEGARWYRKEGGEKNSANATFWIRVGIDVFLPDVFFVWIFDFLESKIVPLQ